MNLTKSTIDSSRKVCYDYSIPRAGMTEDTPALPFSAIPVTGLPLPKVGRNGVRGLGQGRMPSLPSCRYSVKVAHTCSLFISSNGNSC